MYQHREWRGEDTDRTLTGGIYWLSIEPVDDPRQRQWALAFVYRDYPNYVWHHAKRTASPDGPGADKFWSPQVYKAPPTVENLVQFLEDGHWKWRAGRGSSKGVLIRVEEQVRVKTYERLMKGSPVAGILALETAE